MMKQSTLLTLSATTAALLLSLHAPVFAQEQGQEEVKQETTVVTATPNGVVSITTQQGPGAGPGQGPGGFPNFPPGMARMGQFMMGGRQGGMLGLELIDPSHSNVTLLLKRKDVYAELAMSSKQREALEALETKARDDLQQTMQKNMQEMRAQMQQQRAGGGGNPAQTRQERMAQMQERQQQMMQTMTTAMDSIEKKSEALLTAGQRKRVHELDLQWRGPLALSEGALADMLELTPEQRGEVTKLLQDYQQAQGKAMMNLFQGFRPQQGDPNAPNAGTGRAGRGGRNGQNGNGAQNGNGGQNGNGASNGNGQNGQPQNGQGRTGGFNFFQQPTTPEEQRERQAKLDATKAEVEKSRKENGDKVLELLTPEQKMAWRKLQGQKFAFRTVMN